MKIERNLKSLLEGIQETRETGKPDYGKMFMSELSASIEKEARLNVHSVSKSFKPSSMKCERNMQFQILGMTPEPSDISVNLVGILESGTDRHVRLQQDISRMKANGFDCEYLDVAEFVNAGTYPDLDVVEHKGMETKLYNKKWNISFMCDGLIKFHGILFILEIKTESDFKHRNRKGISDEHLAQVCAYYLSFGIDKIMMLYEDRDNCSKFAFSVIETSQDIIDNVTSKIEHVNKYVRDKQIAPPNVGTHCNYCPYQMLCKQSGGFVR